MSILSEAALEALADSRDTVAALEATVAQLESENESLRQQLTLAKDIRSLLIPNVGADDGRQVTVTVTERDDQERIKTVRVE